MIMVNMASEELRGERRREALGDLFGLMLHQAVAEGSVLMAQHLSEGSEEQAHWADVASRAVPLAADYLEGVKGKDYADEPTADTVSEVTQAPDERQLKLDRLATLEAEIAQLRTELGE